MRIVFMGTPDFSVTALARLAERHEIVAVYSQPPRPAGRGQQLRSSPVAIFAEKHGIPVHTPKGLKKPETQAVFSAHNADVAVVAAYGLILPQAILDAPRLGCLNIHASLLPRWRGAAPIQRAIMAGDKVSGVTIMQMDAGLDTGAMLMIRETPITDATTAQGLHDTLATIGAGLIVETLEALEQGRLRPEPQPAQGVTYAEKIDKAEAHIDFTRPAPEVLRHIHGLSPFPGAWFAHGAERIKVLAAERAEGAGAPGVTLDDRLLIACGDGAVRLTIVQRAGKGPAPAEAFLRGYALPKATVLA
ncbi:MAG: methionyl-tRNA formyltransferase [Proteobacteria bacterium]|nr:methionyl-tRNA formyltransferase [Pseudomonadota bacterium]